MILVADDEAPITTALQLLFDLNGLPAEVAHSPAETLARVVRGGVTLVVHDLNFSRGETGGADGIALFRALRKVAPGLPVVVMTSWPAQRTATLLAGEGVSAYLMKPWDDAELVALVRRFQAGR